MLILMNGNSVCLLAPSEPATYFSPVSSSAVDLDLKHSKLGVIFILEELERQRLFTFRRWVQLDLIHFKMICFDFRSQPHS